MTNEGMMFVYLFVILLFCSFTAGAVITISRHAPIHCKFMVPVKNVKGSYGCSQYPYPIRYKK